MDKTDAQTANEEQAKVSGVLDGDSNVYVESVDEGTPEDFSMGGYLSGPGVK